MEEVILPMMTGITFISGQAVTEEAFSSEVTATRAFFISASTLSLMYSRIDVSGTAEMKVKDASERQPFSEK